MSHTKLIEHIITTFRYTIADSHRTVAAIAILLAMALIWIVTHQ